MNARVKMVAAMGIFGTLGPFVRNIDISSGELALYRAVLATILIGVFFILTRRPIVLGQSRRELPYLFASGVAIGLNWILLFEAYKYTTISIATLCYYFAPILVTLVCPILFKEKLSSRQIICFAMSTLGIVLITGIGTDTSGSLLGILCGLGAAVFYATAVVLNKFIKNVDGIDRTMLQFLAAILILLPYVTVTNGFNLERLDSLGWTCLLIVGCIHTGFTYCLYFSSLKDLPGQKVAILNYIDPLVAIAISVLILNETMSGIQIIGGTLILVFTLLNELGPVRKK